MSRFADRATALPAVRLPVDRPAPAVDSATRPARWRAVALVLFALVMLGGVWLRPLIPIDETRYVSVAWEMHVTGEWLVPHKNGEVYTDKPPLLFWLIDLVWRVTGVGENAAQLIGPLFALGCVWLVGPLATRLWPDGSPDDPPGNPPDEPRNGLPDGRRTATAATAVLAGLSVFALYGSGTAFDAMLALAVLLGIGALVRAIRDRRRGGWALYGVALALGVYAKGPVILLHLVPPLALYPLWTVRGARASRGDVARGVALALGVVVALVGPWLVPALIEGGAAYRSGVLWEQSAGRVVDAFAHARPFWFYAAALPLLLFPWAWSRTVWRALGALLRRPDAGTRLCLVWVGATFVLFSAVSGKQLHYLVPTLPGVALLLGRALATRAEDGRARTRSSARALLHPAGLVLGVAALAMLAGAVGPLPLDPTVFGTRAPHGMALAALVPLLGWIALLRLPTLRGLTLAGLAAPLAFDVLVAATPLGAAYDVTPLARELAAHERGGLAVVTTQYDAEFGFAGRLREPLAVLDTPEALAAWLDAHPDGAVVAREDRLHPSWAPLPHDGPRAEPWALWHVADRRLAADAPSLEPVSER